MYIHKKIIHLNLSSGHGNVLVVYLSFDTKSVIFKTAQEYSSPLVVIQNSWWNQTHKNWLQVVHNTFNIGRYASKNQNQ
jgi:hypothetical protein